MKRAKLSKYIIKRRKGITNNFMKVSAKFEQYEFECGIWIVPRKFGGLSE